MIYIIIPSFNEKLFVINLIDSLYKQTFKEFKIIVSDNGSSDGTHETIEDKYPKVKLICNDSSFWWTKSTNEGVKYALKHSESNKDYILTINCDTTIKNNYLEKLFSCAKQNPNSIIGSVNVDIDSNLITFGGTFVASRITAKYKHVNRNSFYNNSLQNNETDFLPGRGTIIPIKTFRKLGYYDEILPHYGADYEFSYRAKKNNIKLIVNYNSPVFAFSGNTGINNEINKLSIIEFFQSFFTIKSPSNLYRRAIFIYKCFPFKYFLVHIFFDFSRVIGGSFLRQIRIKS
mgnify:CR=1 FL=1